MSIKLTIRQVTNIRIESIYQMQSKLSLVVQNSKNGAIFVSPIKFNRLYWSTNNTFTTSIDENVEFILIKGQQFQSQQNIIGKGTLFTKKLIKIFQNRMQSQQKVNSLIFQNQNQIQSQKIVNNLIQYQISLYNQIKSTESQTAIVKINFEFDQSKCFQGQIISSVNLDLKGQLHTNPKFVKLYLGKSSKTNLFNLLDNGENKNSKFRWIESIYKDIQ